MKTFLIVMASTFISFTAALATWDSVKSYLVANEIARLQKEADAEKAAKQAKDDAAQEVVDNAVKKIKYSWRTEDQVNPVTGHRAIAVSRFSEEIDSALTFRCYGEDSQVFDILLSWPKAVDWFNYEGNSTQSFAFRLDGKELKNIRMKRSSEKVGEISLKPSSSAKILKDSHPKYYQEEMVAIDTFRNIVDSTRFEASVTDGTIFQQVISIDVSGIKDAIQPVLELCGKASL